MIKGQAKWRRVVAWVCALTLVAAPVSADKAKDKKDKQDKPQTAVKQKKVQGQALNKTRQDSRIGKSGDARVDIKPVARIDFAPITESSGLARSDRHPGVFWTHNDSGDRARIFAIRADGTVVRPATIDLKDYQGIEVAGARNVDWEDIASDGQGRLIIADCGNNANERRDLAIYIVPEPDPERDLKAAVVKRIPVYYPEQHFAPGEPRNFDSEAVFVADGRIHLLTKDRGDTRTRLYRLESEATDRSNPLKLVGEAEVGDMVTGADISPDGRRLAVLTYSAVWLFEGAGADGNFLTGPARRLPIKAGQCEAVCFEGPDRLLIGNEKGNLFRVPLAWLRPYRGEKLVPRMK